jgi:HPt (histidine-containing phosphotransfer) domain-containing protein
MVVDPQVIHELKALGSDGAVFSRVQALFLKNVPSALSEIMEHARNQNAPALADRVHGLRSMCMTIGAIAASRACEELETAARTSPLGVALPLIAEVEREALAAMKAVKRYA